MRNFILSPNFKNSVKASFLSLVILIASLSFGCCLNASAMFDDEFSTFEDALANNSGNLIIGQPNYYEIFPENDETSSSEVNNFHSPLSINTTSLYFESEQPSTFYEKDQNEDRDNNTEPTVIINLSKDVDNEEIKHDLMLTKQTNLSTFEIADKRFPKDPVKKSLYAGELRSFFHSLSGYHTEEEALARFHRDISIPQDGATWLSPSKTSRKYSDEYLRSRREKSSLEQLNNYDYWESEREKFPLEQLNNYNYRKSELDEYLRSRRKKFSPEKINELLEFEKNLQNS